MNTVLHRHLAHRSDSGHPFLRGPLPRAFAHRGWHTGDLSGMENSLSAFRRAVAEGYRYLETDVHATSDGVAVVHHDPVLDRTTDGRGPIREQTWSRVGSALIAGREPVRRLDDVLEDLPDALFNIDVKDDPAVPAVLRTLRRHDAWDRVCVAGFDERRLRMLRTHGDPRMLTSMGQRSVTGLWAASRLPGRRRLPLGGLLRGTAAQVPTEHRGLRVVDSRFVEHAHSQGVEVHVWTVDDADEMETLLDLGVDGLLTDRPDVLRAVLRRRGAWNGQGAPHPAGGSEAR